MKYYTLLLLALIQINLIAQIASPEMDQGDIEDQVTDIVVVFKMHVDIGYTNWA